ncbi:MAG TPA: copper resistance CopC family protein [Catenuloplanes sp.]
MISGPNSTGMEAQMGGTVNRSIRILLSVMVGGLSVLIAAIPAAAHNSLTGSNPKNGARLEKAPDVVQLTFLANLDAKNTQVTVTGPDGTPATAGKPTVNGKKVTVSLRAGAAGGYTVAYQVPSGDGHPVKGRITFTVTSATPATPTAGGPTPAGQPGASGASGQPDAPGQSAPSATVPPPAAPPVAAGNPDALVGDDSPWWPWALGGGALVLLVGGGALLAVRRAR